MPNPSQLSTKSVVGRNYPHNDPLGLKPTISSSSFQPTHALEVVSSLPTVLEIVVEGLPFPCLLSHTHQEPANKFPLQSTPSPVHCG